MFTREINHSGFTGFAETTRPLMPTVHVSVSGNSDEGPGGAEPLRENGADTERDRNDQHQPAALHSLSTNGLRW